VRVSPLNAHDFTGHFEHVHVAILGGGVVPKH